MYITQNRLVYQYIVCAYGFVFAFAHVCVCVCGCVWVCVCVWVCACVCVGVGVHACRDNIFIQNIIFFCLRIIVN